MSSYEDRFDQKQDRTRRVNNAVFISKERYSKDSSEDDSDSNSMISTLTSETLRPSYGIPGGFGDEDNSDSSSSTTVPLGKHRHPRSYDPEAYKKWLKAKNEAARKRRENERTKKKREEMRKKLEEEKRKQESDEKMKRWLERKEQEKRKKEQKQKEKVQKEDNNKTKTIGKWISSDESQSNFKVWLSRVRQQNEETKLREIEKQRMEEEFKQQRKELSTMFYEEWLKTSKNKPKPVPLNQGTESLRGSISKMFINPKPWQSNID
ncbi:coiled-coil domain-containing protein 34-like [Uranotaenia lowii]|uniref:coiled-coil domain-containing protein 34-like n=1 Tax=Uranotaenia lowii TaxID=190385 RepID=UPI0024785938|nr:coiled-coil domain-containing protein 34-like [Uranotaenia lowii]